MWYIINGLVALWHALGEVRNYIRALFRLFLACGGLLATLGAMLWPFISSAEGMNNAAARIEALTGTLGAMPVGYYMEQLNRVFPVTEALSLLAVLYGIKLVAMLLRWARSMIPTLGG